MIKDEYVRHGKNRYRIIDRLSLLPCIKITAPDYRRRDFHFVMLSTLITCCNQSGCFSDGIYFCEQVKLLTDAGANPAHDFNCSKLEFCPGSAWYPFGWNFDDVGNLSDVIFCLGGGNQNAIDGDVHGS